MRMGHRAIRRWAACAAVLMLAGAAPAPQTPRLLVFTHTTGFRHASIEPGVAALRRLAAKRGIEVTVSADPDAFSARGLAGVSAIVLLSTTTDRKDPTSEWLVGPRRDALQAFVRRGGGILGIHAAADSHRGWPWYTRMIGGRFARHPEGTPQGQVRIVDPGHPAVRGLAPVQVRTDEWYYFDDHDPTTRLVATLDPQSIGEADVNPNPMAWSHRFEGGRVFYTAMGHTPESFSEPWFLRHLDGGLAWTLGKD